MPNISIKSQIKSPYISEVSAQKYSEFTFYLSAVIVFLCVFFVLSLLVKLVELHLARGRKKNRFCVNHE